jgi:small conductance mechanosensitive channel
MTVLTESLPVITRFCLKVILAVVAYYAGTKIIKKILKVFRVSMEKTNVDKGVIQFVGSFAKIFLYALLLFSIATSFGVQESSVAALLASAGVTVGLALQGGLSNMAGGVMLLLFKPFQVGDYIIQNESNGAEGTVSKIEICYTTLLSIDNKRIIIPNGELSNSTLTNVTAQKQRRLQIKVQISYDADIRKARAVLQRILETDPDTSHDEEMVVFVDELADSGVVMGLRVWVPTEQYYPIKWRLNQKIKETFDQEGIGIPYPQLDVHICSGAAAQSQE